MNNRRRLPQYLAPLYRQQWNVYAQPPWSGPQQVLKYLARYTCRVAISNERSVGIEGGCVAFRDKHYHRGGRWQTMRLHAHEFVRRLRLHVLPRGFVGFRPFGLLANGHRAAKLASCRKLLAADLPVEEAPSPQPERQTFDPFDPEEPPRCPHCHWGTLHPVGEIRRPRASELIAKTYLRTSCDDTS